MLRHRFNKAIGLTLMLAGLAGPAQAQDVTPAAATEPLTLTLDEALQIALVQNYALRDIRLDVETADAQVRQAWGQLYPQVDLAYSYTRNLKTANPFAGSDAGGLFGSLGFIDWLAFNEQARTDDDPGSEPIAFDEFLDRQRQGIEEAGVTLGASDNPFSIPNQFQGGLSISQTLFNGVAFQAVKGAQQFKDLSRYAVDRQEQILIDDVREAFFTALLAQEQAGVSAQSVARTQRTLVEVSRRVTQGVEPKFQRLTAEVELANLETSYMQIQNQAATSLDALKLTLGIPIEQPLRLRGALDASDQGAYLAVSAEDAMALAFRQRPDLEQARLGVELREINTKLTKAEFLPRVNAFANLNYTGSVPDNRTNLISDLNDPFAFSADQRGFFSSDYWQPSVNVGLRLQWNLFNGFQTKALVQQRQIEKDKAQVAYEQLQAAVKLEVETALRNLRTAQQRILSQEQNVGRAELNYEFAQTRLREGVATQLEERNASEQLDQARLNYLQAVYDFLVARSDFETAVGMPFLARRDDVKLTSN